MEIVSFRLFLVNNQCHALFEQGKVLCLLAISNRISNEWDFTHRQTDLAEIMKVQSEWAESLSILIEREVIKNYKIHTYTHTHTHTHKLITAQ